MQCVRNGIKHRYGRPAQRMVTGQRLLICHAEDTIKNQPLSLHERYTLAERSTRDGRRKRKDLPETIELALSHKTLTRPAEPDPGLCRDYVTSPPSTHVIRQAATR